ncbi:hypothetical protein T02_5986 [Trichinella nativa]|uniref:Uncharacterized protein n=1 Tax=Trichinella nativa TaxID=6335 RepID=A0A0V1LUX9_9BILA|nr:hypothetical protein T06_14936 [Trichinella sp. T6]KRZ63338.1 hypothetical protein T02_5986 [Trichinella nativa]
MIGIRLQPMSNDVVLGKAKDIGFVGEMAACIGIISAGITGGRIGGGTGALIGGPVGIPSGKFNGNGGLAIGINIG